MVSKARAAAWKRLDRAKHPERYHRLDRRASLKKLYGLALEDFETLVKQQRGKCAICSGIFTKTPNVDHDHATGKNRGLLCSSCNTGMRYVDREGWLAAALQYKGA